MRDTRELITQDRRRRGGDDPDRDAGKLLAPTDHRIRDFEDGPWPSAHVGEAPPELYVLYEHVTGRKLELHHLEAIERIRAHLGYQGIAPRSGPSGTWSAPAPIGETARTAPKIPARSDAWFDPDDLGDLDGPRPR